VSTNDSNDMELQDGNILPLKLVDTEANDIRNFNLDEADIEGGGLGLRIQSPNIKPPRVFNYS
jgi:hypothetical protein